MSYKLKKTNNLSYGYCQSGDKFKTQITKKIALQNNYNN